MLSFWEKQSFLNYDAIVIGGGIVGLSTACSLKEKNPEKSVLVLERGIFPSGASTKNAGFACYGSAAEIWHDVQQLGLEKALDVVRLRVQGLKKLRKRLGDEALGYQEFGGGEIILNNENFHPDSLPQLNDWLRPFFGKEVFILENERAEKLGFQTRGIRAFITNTAEGQIDTGKMMKSLLNHSQKLGVVCLTGCLVQKPIQNGAYWKVPVENTGILFQTPEVFICTNAFTQSLFPELEIKPGRGQVLITKPIDNLKFQGIFHFDEGYFYFRNVGTRVLFGGGRNMDFEGETTEKFELNAMIQNRLEDYLQSLILPENTEYEIEDRWTGIMAFGSEKVPIVRDYGNGLKMGCRMNGMGVAMGTEIGEILANL